MLRDGFAQGWRLEDLDGERRSGQWSRLEEMLKAAVTAPPHGVDDFMAWIWLCRHLGKEVDPAILSNARAQMEFAVHDTFLQAQWRALQGDSEGALSLLRTAIEKKPGYSISARFRAAFHPLRADQRFREMTADFPGSHWTDYDGGDEP